MNKELANFKIGSEGHCVVSLQGGVVVASVTYDGTEMAASASITIKTIAGLESLKKMIPGNIDDAVISVIEAALQM